MPLACDPSASRKYVLKADRGLPAEKRPRFLLRFLTRRQKRQYLQLGEEDRATMSARKSGETIALLYARLGEVLLGWENLRLPPTAGKPEGEELVYDPANLQALDDVLTDKELWELYWAGGSEIDEEDLAFFASRPNSGPAESASPEQKGAAKTDAKSRRRRNRPGTMNVPPATAQGR